MAFYPIFITNKMGTLVLKVGVSYELKMAKWYHQLSTKKTKTRLYNPFI